MTVSDTAPVAVDDTASTSKGAAVDINVLGNDTDADGDTLSISGTPTALHGTVSVNGDGTLHYTPERRLHRVPTRSATRSPTGRSATPAPWR